MVTTELKGVYIKSRKGKPQEFASASMKEQDSYLVSMQQSRLSESIVCVEVGEKVLEGTVIGKPNGKYGAFVYSPVSGKVASIVQKLSIYGKLVDHILIIADKKNKTLDFPNIADLSKKSILERLMISGIIDSAGYPDYVKYIRKPVAKARLIISCIDNDPFLSAEEVNLRENVEACVKGANLYMTLVGVSKCDFLFSVNQASAIKALKKYLKENKISNISIKITPYIYPLSINEISKIYSGKVLDSAGRFYSGLYIETGIIAKKLFDAVYLNKPVVSRIMTIAGTGFIRKANFEVKVGTSLQAILDFVGVNVTNSKYKMICGGAMSGVAEESPEGTTTSSLEGVLFLTNSEFSGDEEMPCIRCGKCVDVCPARIMPYKIEELLLSGDYDIASRFGLSCCTECGACSYICPSKRYLAQRLIDGKDKIREWGGRK